MALARFDDVAVHIEYVCRVYYFLFVSFFVQGSNKVYLARCWTESGIRHQNIFVVGGRGMEYPV